MYYFDIQYIIRNLPLLLKGLVLTVEVSLATIVLSSLLALSLVFLRISKNKLLSGTMYYYIQAARNTPTLIKIYMAYFGLPTIGIMFDPVIAGLTALVFDHTAYIIEIYRGGIESISKGQIEAAEGVGFRHWQVIRLVILPQAFRHALPSLANHFILCVKDSSLLSIIAVMELTMVGNLMMEKSGNSYEVFAITALIYLVIISTMCLLFRFWEKEIKFNF